MSDKEIDDRLSRLLKKVENLPENTPEAGAAFQKKLKEMEGTMYEWATLLESGEINVNITGWLKGGARGDNNYTLKPGDEEYEERKTKHKLENAGDNSTIKKVWRNEQWIEIGEENEK